MQRRALETRQRIFDGLLKTILRSGLAGVTHRAVAQAAGVSLAATTRHFSTKADMIAEFSDHVLDGYVSGLSRVLSVIDSGTEGSTRLSDLLVRVTVNGLTRDRSLSLAWCEMMLEGGRSDEGRAMARRWFDEIDRVWGSIANSLNLERRSAVLAVDLSVGYLILLHPVRPDGSDIIALLNRRLSVPEILSSNGVDVQSSPSSCVQASTGRVLAAAIEQVVIGGPQSVSFSAVAQRAGLSRSAPSYHFGSLEALIERAQLALFEQARDRYRNGLRAFDSQILELDRLADVTAAVFTFEALRYVPENLAFYSVWLRSAESDAFRPTILATLAQQQRAWAHALQNVDVPQDRALNMQAVFVGKLVRAIATGADVSQVALARGEFVEVMRG